MLYDSLDGGVTIADDGVKYRKRIAVAEASTTNRTRQSQPAEENSLAPQEYLFDDRTYWSDAKLAEINSRLDSLTKSAGYYRCHFSDKDVLPGSWCWC